jgi:transglutaminase-like putative cysteine protease
MRVQILHQTEYTYETPATRAIQILRLTPRGHDGQFVVNWRLDVDQDCRLEAMADPFGNLVHSFSVEGPLEKLTITAEGEIETFDTNGVVTGQMERFPPVVFLRNTPLTTADAAIRTLGDEVAAKAGSDRLTLLHDLMAAIGEKMRFDTDRTDARTNAPDAFALGHGVCQDFAHVFIAAARYLEIPARYVGGYMHRVDDANQQDAGHAWAEALVEGLGWVGFDPANGMSPTDAHIRVAIGLDYLGAAPVRGARYGGSNEKMNVKVNLSPSGRSARGQSQFQ